jgi:hypothetical protein
MLTSGKVVGIAQSGDSLENIYISVAAEGAQALLAQVDADPKVTPFSTGRLRNLLVSVAFIGALVAGAYAPRRGRPWA